MIISIKWQIKDILFRLLTLMLFQSSSVVEKILHKNVDNIKQWQKFKWIYLDELFLD